MKVPTGTVKLGIVLLLILLSGIITGAWYGVPLFMGAATGMFLAEHFGCTRKKEFLFLLGVPLLFSWLLLLVTIFRDPGKVTVTQFCLWTLLGFCTSIVPATLAIVTLSTLSAVIFKLTGLRLLKSDWN